MNHASMMKKGFSELQQNFQASEHDAKDLIKDKLKELTTKTSNKRNSKGSKSVQNTDQNQRNTKVSRFDESNHILSDKTTNVGNALSQQGLSSTTVHSNERDASRLSGQPLYQRNQSSLTGGKRNSFNSVETDSASRLKTSSRMKQKFKPTMKRMGKGTIKGVTKGNVTTIKSITQESMRGIKNLTMTDIDGSSLSSSTFRSTQQAKQTLSGVRKLWQQTKRRSRQAFKLTKGTIKGSVWVVKGSVNAAGLLVKSIVSSISVSMVTIVLITAIVMVPIMTITGFIEDILGFFTITNNQAEISKINNYISELDHLMQEQYYDFSRYQDQELEYEYDPNVTIQSKPTDFILYYTIINPDIRFDELKTSIETHHKNLYKIQDQIENSVLSRKITVLDFETYLKNNVGHMLSEDDYKRWIQRKESGALDALKTFGSPFPTRNWELYITSHFGYRIDPIVGGTAFHNGIDIAFPTGEPIHSPISGTVRTTVDSYGALIVSVTHDNIVVSMVHLDSFSVKTGQVIQQGDVVGTVGNTGYSTGSHLHLSIRIDGELVDPYLYLRNTQP